MRRPGSGHSIVHAMPVAVHIAPRKLSREDYDRLIGALDATGAGVDAGIVQVHPLHSPNPG